MASTLKDKVTEEWKKHTGYRTDASYRQAQEKREALYLYHYVLLNRLTSADLKYLRVDESGRIQKEATETTSEEQEAALEVAHALYRQANGGLISAQFGYRLMEDALKELNDLKFHLQNHFPEALPKPDPNAPLGIFLHRPKAPGKLQKVRQRIGELAQKCIETIRRAMRIYGVPVEEAVSGITPTRWMKRGGARLAVEKREDAYLTDVLAEQSPNLTATDVTDFPVLHEQLLSDMTQFGLHLNVPLVVAQEGRSLHAFAESKGSLSDVLTKEGEAALSRLNKESCQRTALCDMLVGQWDRHPENILVTETGHLILIDNARCLGPDPLHPRVLLGSFYMDLPGMDEAFSERDRLTYANLNIPHYMQNLKRSLTERFEEQLRPEKARHTFEQEMDHLEARLVLIQESCRANLTPRQITALFLPPIPRDKLKQMEGLLSRNPQSYLKITNTHLKQNGFKKAWALALRAGAPHSPAFKERFREEIAKEIGAIQATPPDQLFSQNERQWYGKVSLVSQESRIYHPLIF